MAVEAFYLVLLLRRERIRAVLRSMSTSSGPNIHARAMPMLTNRVCLFGTGLVSDVLSFKGIVGSQARGAYGSLMRPSRVLKSCAEYSTK